MLCFNSKRRVATGAGRGLMLSALCAIFCYGQLFAQVQPPPGPAPVVNGVEAPGVPPPSSAAVASEPSDTRPNHPPIEQIPAMPMPDSNDPAALAAAAAPASPGAGVYH